MKRSLAWVFVFSALGLAPSTSQASLERVASASPASGEGGYGSAIIDTAGGFAYFGSSTTFVLFTTTRSAVTPVRLAPFGVNNGVGYFNRVTNLAVALFDESTRYRFFVSSQAPAAIEVLPLGGGAISSMTFLSGQNWIRTAVLDSTHHLAYFGTNTSSSVIVKTQIPDGVIATTMTIVSSITLPAGLDFLSASVIDVENGFAYFASSTTPGAVAKIDLSNFTLAATLTFNSDEGGIGSAVIDTTHQFAYFGTHDHPGKVIKVRLSDFSRDSSLTLKAGEDDLTSAVLDVSRGRAYFGTNTAPGIVVPIICSTLFESTPVTLETGEDFLRSAVIDAANSYAYFGTYTTPGVVVQMDLLAGAPEISVQPGEVTTHAGETATFSLLATGRGLSYQWQRDGVSIAGATSASYSFATVGADDGATFLCVVTGTNGATASRSVSLTIIPVIRAFPNPWRADRHLGTSITFDGLLPNSRVKIFNLAAQWVKTLPLASGSTTWDKTNDNGQQVASGYYFYLITSRSDRQTVRGKLAIIK